MAEPDFTAEELSEEVWLPIPGYELFYSISSLGRVRSSFSNNRILKTSIDSSGYPHLTLCKPGHRLTKKTCRLVALAFLGPSELQVNHKDGNKINNRLSNLEYVTQQENMTHAKEHGLLSRGDDHYSRKHPERLARGARHGSVTHPEKILRGDNHPSRRHPERIAKGERNGGAKLKEYQVEEIRHKLSQGSSVISLADEYKVSDVTIYRIKHRTHWK